MRGEVASDDLLGGSLSELCQPLLLPSVQTEGSSQHLRHQHSQHQHHHNQQHQDRFSAVAMEMLREQEDRDLHPFGRGGRFEGVLYSRRVKVQVDHTKFLAWIVFASFILLTSAAIIFLAEMERRQKAQQSLATSDSPTNYLLSTLSPANASGSSSTNGSTTATV